MSQSVAIIGSGISGLSTAYHLHQMDPSLSISIFEANDYFGGHTDTHRVTVADEQHNIDTGFIVFNDLNYPVFNDMLKELKVPVQYTDMSFSVANSMSKLTYNPSKQWQLLSRPQNFLRKGFIQMLKDIMRFYEQGQALNLDNMNHKLTLGEYLDLHEYSQLFRDEHIYPMCGALWSASPRQTEALPLKFVIGFFSNHRMLQLKDRPLWKTIIGGSNTYVSALKQQLGKNVRWHQTAVRRVKREQIEADGARQTRIHVVTDQGDTPFDHLVFACHADDALTLLGTDASEHEQHVLGDFEFRTNQMVLHTDASIMPTSKSQWASWHVHVAQDPIDITPHYSITYWMNRLQQLNSSTPFFATLNPNQTIAHDAILQQRTYTHPIYHPASFAAQTQWHRINGHANTHYCGAYWGYGFHEDGAASGLRAACALLNTHDQRLHGLFQLEQAKSTGHHHD